MGPAAGEIRAIDGGPVAELEAEAAKVEAVCGLIPLYEAKIQRTLARV